jgi:DNA (cytosine-5)-methyltransferase 1
VELPRVIDLFSGCGGLALGFHRAGFKLGGSVEFSPAAAATFRANLGSGVDSGDAFICGDICEVDPDRAFQSCPEGYSVTGGPPCQAYSRVGRGKLRSLGEDRNHLADSRGVLFEEYLRVALAVAARALVMENVVDSLNYGGKNIPELVCKRLEKRGYRAEWTILNAADYGVPQVRERVILMAVRQEDSNGMKWPVPTHRSPDGREAAGLRGARKALEKCRHFVAAPQAKHSAEPWVTVGMALDDLPALKRRPSDPFQHERISTERSYARPPGNAYQHLMRKNTGEWIGTTGHVHRNTPRDYSIFERMQAGDDYRQASAIADQLLAEACRRIGALPSSPIFETLRKQIVPPYDRNKFHDKWRRLSASGPSHTLVAHLGTDTYSHIHPWEPRGISVREAARLQSFPDDFLFWGSLNDAYTEIGNSVPPLLSFAIAKALLRNLQPRKAVAV